MHLFQHVAECSGEILRRSGEVVMTTLTIATGDYSNVSAAELLYVKQFPYDELLPIHSSHSQRAPPASFDAFLFMQIKGKDLIIHTLGQNRA